MAKYCTKHHGTPDLIAAHGVHGILAIEIKLGHERIAPHQLETMRRLTQWGVKCEVWRMMPAKNKVREKQINLASWSQTGDLKNATEKVSYDQRIRKKYR